MLAEAAFIGLHQTHLTDRRSGLQIVYRSRTSAPAEALHAFGNRAGRYQHHFATAGVERGDLTRPIAQRVEVQSRTLIRHQAAAYFDDDALALGQYGFHVRSHFKFLFKTKKFCRSGPCPREGGSRAASTDSGQAWPAPTVFQAVSEIK